MYCFIRLTLLALQISSKLIIYKKNNYSAGWRTLNLSFAQEDASVKNRKDYVEMWGLNRYQRNGTTTCQPCNGQNLCTENNHVLAS